MDEQISPTRLGQASQFIQYSFLGYFPHMWRENRGEKCITGLNHGLEKSAHKIH